MFCHKCLFCCSSLIAENLELSNHLFVTISLPSCLWIAILPWRVPTRLPSGSNENIKRTHPFPMSYVMNKGTGCIENGITREKTALYYCFDAILKDLKWTDNHLLWCSAYLHWCYPKNSWVPHTHKAFIVEESHLFLSLLVLHFLSFPLRSFYFLPLRSLFLSFERAVFFSTLNSNF